MGKLLETALLLSPDTHVGPISSLDEGSSRVVMEERHFQHCEVLVHHHVRLAARVRHAVPPGPASTLGPVLEVVQESTV